MAGVTQDDVAAAVQSLTARGERVTIRAVRAELGTGSLGTIQRHMLQVQPSAQGGSAELSADVLRALAQEVQRVTADAVATLRAQLQTADIDRQALAHELERITDELATSRAAQADAERALAVTQATLAGVQARLDDAHGLLARVAVPPATEKKPSTRKPPTTKMPPG